MSLKVAIYYDWLNQWGGAERVFLNILKLYPQADIYTLDYQPQKTPWLPKTHQVFTLNLKNKLIYTPFYSYRLEQIDFSQYDLLISTTSHVGHSFLTLPKTVYLCYFHNINRYLYQVPPFLLKKILKKYQKIDFIYAQRPDALFCNSKTVAKRIQKHYHRPATVVYPGINTDKFIPNAKKAQNYFLLVSRLVKHKKIDIAIQAFKKLNYPLKIVGTGRDYQYFKKLTRHHPNIQFLASVSESKLIHLYQNAQALIHPQFEDFGLTVLEAMACGRGVIAYNRGGATETVINGKTGILFNRQNSKSLILAVKKYLKKPSLPADCRRQALKFSHQNFMLHFKKEINSLCTTS